MDAPALLPIRDIRPHEAVQPGRAWRVRQAILRAGMVYKPLIVEARTLTLIDGHHRLHALTTLGARYVPAILVDYGRDVEAIEASPRTLPYSTLSEAEDAIREHARRGPATLRLHAPDGSATLNLDPLDLHIILGRLEAPGPVRAIPEPLGPGDVVRAAQRGLLLPPRTTLHVTWAKKIVAPVGLEALFRG